MEVKFVENVNLVDIVGKTDSFWLSHVYPWDWEKLKHLKEGGRQRVGSKAADFHGDAAEIALHFSSTRV